MVSVKEKMSSLSRRSSNSFKSGTSSVPSSTSYHSAPSTLSRSNSFRSSAYHSAPSTLSRSSSFRSSTSSVPSSRMRSIRSFIGKIQGSPKDSATSMEVPPATIKRRNVYEHKSVFINVPKTTLVSKAQHIRQVFEHGLRITEVALEKAQWIIDASKSKTLISKNTVAKVAHHAESIKRFIHDIKHQQSEWIHAISSSKKTAKLPNWPLTPLSPHGVLEGMHYTTAHEHASANVAAFMNEVGHIYQKSVDEAKREKITRSTYDFNQAKTKAELNHRLKLAQQVMHPSLQPYLTTSYHKALKHL